jgi:hypothetical protein
MHLNKAVQRHDKAMRGVPQRRSLSSTMSFFAPCESLADHHASRLELTLIALQQKIG